jgi:localization factor PodJL
MPQRFASGVAATPFRSHAASEIGVGMSNFRSQLDRLTQSRDEAAAPRRSGRQAIDAVQRDIDRAWHVQPRPPVRTEPARSAPDIDRLQAEIRAVRSELARAMDRASEAHDMRSASRVDAARAAAEAQTREMSGLAGGLASLRAQGEASARILEQIAGEMLALRSAVESLSRQPAPRPVDGAALARSIEDGYANLAHRLDDVVSRFAATPEPQPSVELGMLGEHVTAIRDAIDALPVRFPIGAVHQQLDQLAVAIERMAGEEAGSIAGRFAELNERLDEVTRALVTLSVGGGSDLADRIEARLSSLAKSVEKISAELAAPRGAEDAFAGEIRESLAAIGEHLSRGDPGGGAELLQSIEAQMRQLGLKLDNIPAMQSAAGDLAGADSALARLEAVAERLSSAAPASTDGNFAAAIEHQLDGLGRRLDALASVAAARPKAELPDELSCVLEEIGARLESMENAQRPVLPDSGEMARLGEKLERLTESLAARDADGVDLSPLAQRLDGIEQQVALSRDIAIDVAAQAAERAVALATLANTGGDASSSALAADIRGLQAATETLAGRSEAIDSLGSALAGISARLGDLESRLAGARSAPQEFEADAEDFTAPQSRDDRDTPPLQSVDAAPPLDGDAGEAGAVADPANDAGGQTAPEVRTDARIDATVDGGAEPVDVPLEPGTGAPDLAELVRRASARRQGAKFDGPAVSAADVIAAARRAAQAAARDAAARPVTPEKKAAPAPVSNRLTTLAGLLAGKRNLLAGVSLAVLVALGGTFIAIRFLRGGETVAVAPVVEQPVAREQQKVEAGPVAETQERAAERQVALPDIGRKDAQVIEAAKSGTGDAGSGGIAAEPAVQKSAGGAAAGEAALTGKEITKAPTPPEEAGNVLIREAAAAGNPAALFEIGRRYTDGDVVERDLAKAAEWYRHAAQAGYAPAQYRLGNFHEKGHGVGIDLAEAAGWYRKAAEQGNALAMHNLAVLLTSGLVGGKPEMADAIGWFVKAADLGVKDSQVNLGILLTRGMGVKENLVEAYKWFAVAARGGDADAATKRDTLANAMRPDQLAEARGIAELWKPKPLDPAANQATADPQWMNAPGKSAAANGEDMIARAQALLAKLGFDPGPADGRIGAKTRDAVKAFQKRAGLKADGEIDAELIEALLKGKA